ncbi:MAG: 3-deoxy-D-manno-octulosonic acid transferase [Candidatus Omnitrophica bacterium]|nr:3-deoxy-D-manno-octulosonic acid transferase [Candidatus Omnitrophota bacterium]
MTKRIHAPNVTNIVMRLIVFIYDVLFLILFLFYLPFLFLSKKWHDGFFLRLGWPPELLQQELQGKRNIWIHAVSVGEILAVLGLLKRLKERFPEHRLVLTTVTLTGYQLAKTNCPSDILVIFAPLDLSWVVKKFIRMINPVIYISAETEIWPNLFRALSHAHVPLVIVNGRISDKAFERYAWIRPFLKSILSAVHVFCMQSDTDASRIIALGADFSKVKVVGNIKFDEVSEIHPIRPGDLGLSASDMLWIAGSTHPGEEDIVLNTFKALKLQWRNIHLVLAPRHIDRVADVQSMVKEHGLQPINFSQLDGSAVSSHHVIVVDTIGHLRALYSAATIVFVGKSLTGWGGQNIIEPAIYGKPILVGPHMENFRNVLKIFEENQAIVKINNRRELLHSMERLLKNSKERESLGQRARQVVQKYQGATQKTQDVIEHILKI